MIKPLTCQSSSSVVAQGVWPLFTPSRLLTIRRCLETGLFQVGWKEEKEKGEASVVSLISEGRAWVDSNCPRPFTWVGAWGEQVYTGQQVLGSVGTAEGSYLEGSGTKYFH